LSDFLLSLFFPDGKVFSLANRVRHLHVFDKLIVNKVFVMNPKAMDEVSVRELLYFEELIAHDLLLEPKPTLDEVGAHFVDPRETHFDHKSNASFDGMQDYWSNLFIFFDEPPKELFPSFGFSFQELFDGIVAA
jgi:hypothetical protein